MIPLLDGGVKRVHVGVQDESLVHPPSIAPLREGRPVLGFPGLISFRHTLVLVALATSCGPSDEELSRQCFQDSGALYEQRIKPLLESDQPKTCNQCHLSGVDLSVFVRDSMCETRACLLDNGLVDPNDIDNSQILGWIARAQPESELITQEVIDEEYEGFRQFLTQLVSCSNASCPDVHCGSVKGPGFCERAGEPAAPTLTDPATQCDSQSVEATFRDTVFVWRERCFPCHHDDQLKADPAAPRWIEVGGNCETAAVATLRNVIDRGLIDATAPDQSLILLKPLPETEGGVLHGGGDKFHDKNDKAYQSFLSFAEYYAGCVAADMPY
jgi:hypothetical protein